MSEARKIAILGTGGTIAGLGAAQGGGVGYAAGQVEVAQLLRPMLQTAAVQASGIVTQQVAQLDSKDMDVTVWVQLAQACQSYLLQPDVVGVVITHGTDTLEETAWFLQCVLQPSKPVVLTCAMRPANALSADGPANLRDALAVAAQSGGQGVWVVAAGEVHAAVHIHKAHPYRVHAFHSGESGPAAWVEEGHVRWRSIPFEEAALSKCPEHCVCLGSEVLQLPAQQWPWVELVVSTAAARGQAVDALVAAGVQGIVVACTGNGSVHTQLAAALHRAQAAGVRVWRTTRCEMGAIVEGEVPQGLAVSRLSPYKARISLMLQLLSQQRPVAPLDGV